MKQQHTLMKIDPATGEPNPFPSHAAQWREYHGSKAWLFNPWADQTRLRDPNDIGGDPFGLLIRPSNEPLYAEASIESACIPLVPVMRKVDGGVLLPDYGLMFATETLRASSWEHAKALASEHRACGFTDWTLPTDTELQLLIRRDKHKPAIDTDFFPDTKTDDWYWTATPHASHADYAWIVTFGYGSVNNNRRGGSGYVRAVRRVPARQ